MTSHSHGVAIFYAIKKVGEEDGRWSTCFKDKN